MAEKKLPNNNEAILQLLYFGIDSKGNFFSEKWTCPPKEFRKHMDKWNENYVDTIRYENVIKYIDNLFDRDYSHVHGWVHPLKRIADILSALAETPQRELT